jgi:hypothetical protein
MIVRTPGTPEVGPDVMSPQSPYLEILITPTYCPSLWDSMELYPVPVPSFLVHITYRKGPSPFQPNELWPA